MRHVLSLFELEAHEIASLLQEAALLKAVQRRQWHTLPLSGRVMGLVFEKPSLRTRVSFQAAIAQLGGASVFLAGSEVGLGSRESVPDFARVMTQYVDVVVLRTFRHATVELFAGHASCPVINGLSDDYHPCQALGDLLTIQEVFGELTGRTVAFVGDGNNVAKSLAIGCGRLGVRFVLAAPEGYRFCADFLKAYRREVPTGELTETADAAEAVAGADVVYTDVWTSMGQEAEHDERLRRFADYQVNAELMKLAPPHAKVMHCLPAHRGEEITSDVFDSERSIVFQQASNRLHAQKALLQWLLS
jgi:ornithine carbamoyltransferase